MALSAAKLRAVVNLLADELQAHAAAHVLANEAKERNVLVADLIAEALAPALPAPPPPQQQSAAYDFRDTERLEPAIGKQLSPDAYGLRTWVVRETALAWLVETPKAWGLTLNQCWLPKSQCEHHGEDKDGRAILIIPMWLVSKKRAGQ